MAHDFTYLIMLRVIVKNLEGWGQISKKQNKTKNPTGNYFIVKVISKQKGKNLKQNNDAKCGNRYT